MNTTFTNPTTLRCYDSIRVLGRRGGFGVTHLVENNGNYYALKKLTPSAGSTDADVATFEEMFEQEAALLSSLNHPQIPRYVDFFQQNGKLHLVQEFIDAPTLQEVLYGEDEESGQFRPLSEGQVTELLSSVLGILRYLHDRGIKHRDVKPENIMMPYDDVRGVFKSAKLIDLGIAHSGPGPAMTIVGTPVYIAPEVSSSEGAQYASDIYGLGVTALYCLYGEDAFLQQLENFRQNTRGPHWEPTNLIEFIEKMVTYRVADRFKDASACLQHLNRLHLRRSRITEFAQRPTEATLVVAPARSQKTGVKKGSATRKGKVAQPKSTSKGFGALTWLLAIIIGSFAGAGAIMFAVDMFSSLPQTQAERPQPAKVAAENQETEQAPEKQIEIELAELPVVELEQPEKQEGQAVLEEVEVATPETDEPPEKINERTPEEEANIDYALMVMDFKEKAEGIIDQREIDLTASMDQQRETFFNQRRKELDEKLDMYSERPLNDEEVRQLNEYLQASEEALRQQTNSILASYLATTTEDLNELATKYPDIDICNVPGNPNYEARVQERFTDVTQKQYFKLLGNLHPFVGLFRHMLGRQQNPSVQGLVNRATVTDVNTGISVPNELLRQNSALNCN